MANILQLPKSCGLRAKTSCTFRGVNLENARRMVNSPELKNNGLDLEPKVEPGPMQKWQEIPSRDVMNDGENTGILIWENYQDLTNWCADTTAFPSEYDFHIGESTTTRDTGIYVLNFNNTKYQTKQNHF